jgi:hypothetical protein
MADVENLIIQLSIAGQGDVIKALGAIGRAAEDAAAG